MTQKLTVTYKAPPGDSKVTEAFGHTFYDGKPEEIEVDDETLARLQGNRTFDCGKPTEVKEGEKKVSDADHKAADAAALASENAKRAAQGQPPLEDGTQHPKSGEAHGEKAHPDKAKG